MGDLQDRALPGRLSVFLYGLAVFFSAAGALVIEIVAGRMIAPYVGMSLYTWTAIISVVLAGLSVGHWLGGLWSETTAQRAQGLTALLLGCAAVAAIATLPLLRVVAPAILSMDLAPVPAIVLISSALFFLPSFFLGAVSPILTRLALSGSMDSPGPLIGIMFAAGALGSIIGTLSAGYLFISWIGTTGTLLSVASLFAVMAVCFLIATRQTAKASALAAPILIAGLATILWADQSDALTSPCLEESDYYCIRVEDVSLETGRPSRVLVLDHLAHGINDERNPTYLHSSYLELVDLMVDRRFNPQEAFSAFFIGGGANTLPRAWQESHPDADLHISEVDPAVTRVSRDHLWFAPSETTRLDHHDSRAALLKLAEETRFDVILGDAFHDISVPQHLTTLEFAKLLRRRLTNRGFYALNVVDGADQPLFLYAVCLTLAQVFPQVEVWIDLNQLAGGERLTYLVIAGATSSGAKEIQSDRIDGTSWRLWPPEDLARSIVTSGVPILSDDFAPVDRLISQVAQE